MPGVKRTEWWVDVDDDLYTLYFGKHAMIETDHDEIGTAGIELLERVAVMLNAQD